MGMLQSRKSGAYCYCCNESLVLAGIARAREEREWRRDAIAGEVDGGRIVALPDETEMVTLSEGYGIVRDREAAEELHQTFPDMQVYYVGGSHES